MPQEQNNKNLHNLLETVNNIKETVDFVKETAVTKEEFKETAVTKEEFNDLKENIVTKQDFISFKENLEEEIDEKITESKNEIVNKIDGFISLHEKVDLELTALRSKYNRLEAQMQKVMSHLHLQ